MSQLGGPGGETGDRDSGTGRRVMRNDAAHRIQTDVVSVFVPGTLLLSRIWAPAQPRRMSREERFRNPNAWPSLSELVERSDTIVAGEVLEMRSAWTADRREIFTAVTLRPDRRFKGGERSLIRFRIPGGTVGNTRLMVTHAPVFAIGEQALVFLAGESGRLPGRAASGPAPAQHRGKPSNPTPIFRELWPNGPLRPSALSRTSSPESISLRALAHLSDPRAVREMTLRRSSPLPQKPYLPLVLRSVPEVP